MWRPIPVTEATCSTPHTQSAEEFQREKRKRVETPSSVIAKAAESLDKLLSIKKKRKKKHTRKRNTPTTT